MWIWRWVSLICRPPWRHLTVNSSHVLRTKYTWFTWFWGTSCCEFKSMSLNKNTRWTVNQHIVTLMESIDVMSLIPYFSQEGWFWVFPFRIWEFQFGRTSHRFERLRMGQNPRMGWATPGWFRWWRRNNYPSGWVPRVDQNGSPRGSPSNPEGTGDIRPHRHPCRVKNNSEKEENVYLGRKKKNIIKNQNNHELLSTQKAISLI